MITQAYEKLKQLNFDNFGTIYIGYIGVPKYGCLSNEMVSSFVEDYFLRTEVIPNELSEVLNELLVIDKDTSRDDVLNLLRKVVNTLNIDISKSSHKWLLVCLDLKLNGLSLDPMYGLLELSNFWIDWGQPKNSPHMIQGVNNDVDASDYYTEENYKKMIDINYDWLKLELSKERSN